MSVVGFCEDILDWIDERLAVFTVVIMAILVLMLVVVTVAFAATMTSETFSLTKADWDCTASHKETTTAYVPVGEVMVPQFTDTELCDRYERKGR